uniref:Uncharacterized protein n=1 Tax=Manihot esculenta TaxID=3983 RepID=A0A2C9W4S0_MANES
MKCCIFKKKEMSNTLVCVKKVKQETPEEWDENMPLPGDIVEGFAEDDNGDELFLPAKSRSELSSQLGKLSQHVDPIWLKVRRGDATLKLRVNVVQEKSSLLHKRFSFKAVTDYRHVAVLGDLTSQQCRELQEMSRKVVNAESGLFREKGVKYNWKMKTSTYLPDQQSSVVSSILFMPMQGENFIEATTGRCMAWFSAAVSSGIPLVFVNIQTELMFAGKESIWGEQQNHFATIQTMHGIRLWFLPGVAEVVLEMTLEPGELRFGMDIKRTDEGFICVYSVTKDSAADRAGIRQLYEEANKTDHLLTLASAIEQMDSIQVHFMSWPNQTIPCNIKAVGAAALQPPREY